MSKAPPLAAKRTHEWALHGDRREDPYAWLKDPNWQDVMQHPEKLDPDIRSYLEAENTYTEGALSDTLELQETLFAEMKARIKEDDTSVPFRDGPYSYFHRYREGGQHPLFCRYAGDTKDQDEVLIDGDALAEGLAYFQLGAVEHSPDHSKVAYSFDDKGSEFYSARIVEPENGALLPDRLENLSGNLEWSAGSDFLFYVKLDDHHRPKWVYRHKLGTPQSNDVLIYEEQDPGFFVSVSKSESGQFIFVDSHDHETSEIRFVPADSPAAELRLIEPRQKGLEYDVSHLGDKFLILTNEGKAEDFKIVEAPISQPGKAQWTDRVPHVPGCLILEHLAFKSFHVRLERQNALPRIVVSELDGVGDIAREQVISFEEKAYSLGLSQGYEFDTDTLRYTYSSPTTPQQTVDYRMASGVRLIRKTQEVPSGHDPEHYKTERIEATADDGETVPITLLYRKDEPPSASSPLLLYGYGAYGHAIPASFSTNRLSLVNRGFVYAIAHIRGGKDKGDAWYRNGKLDNKTNTFTDFIAAARHLIAEGFTSEGRIVAHGGSAGGMLMGAVANMAPSLFGAIIADVPFVDVLTTMCDESLPLTPPEWPEWGNPLTDKEAYATIKSYSPYDNVREQAYPHILVTAGLTDPRVTYWEPAKWVAKLRNMKTDDNTLLLKTNMDAGHGGASGRFDYLKEVALAYAFALTSVKVE